MFTAEAEEEPFKKDERILEPVEAIQAVAWMEMMYEDSGLTIEKANEAAMIIQVTISTSTNDTKDRLSKIIKFTFLILICR